MPIQIQRQRLAGDGQGGVQRNVATQLDVTDSRFDTGSQFLFRGNIGTVAPLGCQGDIFSSNRIRAPLGLATVPANKGIATGLGGSGQGGELAVCIGGGSGGRTLRQGAPLGAKVMV